MNHLIGKAESSKIPIYTIDESIGDHQNDERILVKLAEINAILAEGELPNCIYEMQTKIKKKHRYSIDITTESLAMANEQSAEYGVLKTKDKA